MYKPLEVFIGLRYTRAKRRNHFISFISLTSILGIMLGVALLIVVLSVMNGFHKEIRERILGMASHATISAIRGGLDDWESVLARAGEHPRVVGAAPYVEGQGMLVRGGNVSGVLFRGIDVTQEPVVSNVGEHITRGRFDSLTPGSYNLILGAELARALGVGVGDKLTLVTPQVRTTPVGAMPRLKRFRVSGLFEVGMGEYDRGIALMHIDDAAKLMRLEDAVSGVRLKLDDLYDAPFIARELANQMDGLYRVSDWTREHRNFFGALQTEKRMMFVILFLIVVVAAFNIVSTLVMVVADKQSDIAILRTLGASPLSVMRIFIVQGATLGLVGTLLGVGLGVVLANNLEAIVSGVEHLLGIQILDPNIYYISEVPSHPRTQDIVLIGVTTFVVTLLATLYPARRAARTQPAEALRYE